MTIELFHRKVCGILHRAGFTEVPGFDFYVSFLCDDWSDWWKVVFILDDSVFGFGILRPHANQVLQYLSGRGIEELREALAREKANETG